MRALVLSAALLFAASVPAFADDQMANYYGNTVVVTDAKGGVTHTHYNADHTFDGVATASGFHYKGTWEITGGQLCHTFDPPLPGIANPKCNPVGPLNVGQSWTGADGSSGSLVQGVL